MATASPNMRNQALSFAHGPGTSASNPNYTEADADALRKIVGLHGTVGFYDYLDYFANQKKDPEATAALNELLNATGSPAAARQAALDLPSVMSGLNIGGGSVFSQAFKDIGTVAALSAGAYAGVSGLAGLAGAGTGAGVGATAAEEAAMLGVADTGVGGALTAPVAASGLQESFIPATTGSNVTVGALPAGSMAPVVSEALPALTAAGGAAGAAAATGAAAIPPAVAPAVAPPAAATPTLGQAAATAGTVGSALTNTGESVSGPFQPAPNELANAAATYGANGNPLGTLGGVLNTPGVLPVAGAVLGAAGASGDNTTTASTAPWAPAQPYLTASMDQAQQYANAPLPYGSATEMVAPLTPEQQAGGQMITQGAQGAQNVVDTAQTGIQPFLRGDYMNVDSNPYLQASMSAAIRPLTQSYQENVLPGIRGTYAGSDAYDNSRQGIAEGIAARGYLDAVAGTTAGMANRGYETGMQATSNSFSQVPGLTTAASVPGQAQWNIGSLLQGQTQKEIDAKAAFDAMKLQKIQQPFNIFSAAGRGGQVSTQQAPQANPYLAALGGAVTAAQIPSLLKQGGIAW